jgi:hypothetical protein
VSWVRLDIDLPMDGRLTASGHAWAWPAVLTRAKSGDGYVSARDISPRVMAHLWGPSVEAWSDAVAYFLEEGLLVVDGDGYRVEGWSETQRDNTGAERQRRLRASRRETTEEPVEESDPSRDVTRRHATSRDNSDSHATSRDVTDGHAYSTVQDRTVQDRTTTSSSSSSLPPPPSRTPEEDEDLRSVVDGWLSTQLTTRGHIRTQATGHELEALRRTLGTHGREKTLAAIRAAANTAETGSPKLSLLLAIAERGVYEGPPPERRKPERSSSTSTTSKKQQLADADDYWAEGREASRRLGGRRVTHVPGVGYIATEELTAEHIAAVEAAGFAVI